ncbi:MAG: hypothetical protein ACLFQX_09770 [Candidatus Kapaibacterium sp.]
MKILILIAIFLASTSAYANNILDDSTVTCYAWWETGDVRRYELRKGKISNTPESADTSSFGWEVEISCLKSGPEGYEMKWENILDNKIPEQAVPKADGYDAGPVYGAILKTPIIYATDEYGAFINVLNSDDFELAADSALTHISEKEGVSFKVEQKIREIILSPQFIRKAIFSELYLYHSPYQGVYSMAQDSMDFPMELEGGRRIARTIFFNLKEINRKHDYFDLEIRVRYDQPSISRIIEEFLMPYITEFAPRDSVQKFMDVYLEKAVMSQVQEYRVSISTGWVEYMKSTSMVRFEGEEYVGVNYTEMKMIKK